MRPEITRLLPRKSKKDRNRRVEFVCPTCNKLHVMRLTDFDRVTNGKYPCPKNKEASFKAWVDKQVAILTAEQKSVINQMLSEGKSQKTIIKRFSLPHPAVLHAIMRPKQDIPIQPPTKATSAHEANAPATVPPRSVVNSSSATVNMVQLRPEPKMPDFPVPRTSKFDALTFAQQLAAQTAWAKYDREQQEYMEEKRRVLLEQHNRLKT